MFEATSTLLRFLSKQLSLHRVQANVDPGHKASIDCSNVLVFSPRAIFVNEGSLAKRSGTRYSVYSYSEGHEKLPDENGEQGMPIVKENSKCLLTVYSLFIHTRVDK